MVYLQNEKDNDPFYRYRGKYIVYTNSEYVDLLKKLDDIRYKNNIIIKMLTKIGYELEALKNEKAK